MRISLDSKKINLNLKHGWTLDDFTRKFQCSNEDFLNFLKRNFSTKACKGFLNAMKKNEKKINNHSSHSSIDLEKSEVTTECTDTIQEDIITMEKNNTHEELKKLKEKEDALITGICSEEKVHKSLISQRRTLNNSLKKQKDLMLELKAVIKQRQQEVDCIVVQLLEISKNISNANLKIAEDKKVLAKVRSDIKALEKIIIFVYENGEIDTENFVIDISDTWNDVFNEISHNELVEDLSIKQTKQLAKLLVIVQILKSNNLNYDITFESETVQYVFNTLLSLKQRYPK